MGLSPRTSRLRPAGPSPGSASPCPAIPSLPGSTGVASVRPRLIRPWSGSDPRRHGRNDPRNSRSAACRSAPRSQGLASIRPRCCPLAAPPGPDRSSPCRLPPKDLLRARPHLPGGAVPVATEHQSISNWVGLHRWVSHPFKPPSRRNFGRFPSLAMSVRHHLAQRGVPVPGPCYKAFRSPPSAATGEVEPSCSGHRRRMSPGRESTPPAVSMEKS